MIESDPIVSQAGRPRDARDTSPEAFAVQLACLRNMSPAERIRRMCRMSRAVRKMAFDAIRRRHPGYDDREERQWGDAAKLLSLLGDQADVEYLRRSAASVGVDDLLGRLLRPHGDTAT